MALYGGALYGRSLYGPRLVAPAAGFSASVSLDALLTDFYFLVAPSVTARTSSQYTLSGTLSALGDVYAVATLDTDTDPDEEQIVEGKNGADGAALGVGSAHDVTEFSFAVTGANLADQLTHDLHVVGRRNA